MTAPFHDVESTVSVTVARSAGTDGAVVVFIDTTFEPNASDGGPGLRVVVNDFDVLNASGRDRERGEIAATGGVDYAGGGSMKPNPQRVLVVMVNDLKEGTE